MLDKDIKSPAKKGFQFILEFTDAVRLVKDYGLKMSFPEDRIRVRFKNIDQVDQEQVKLLRYYPGECLTIYSIELVAASKLKPNLYRRIVESLSTLRNDPKFSQNKDFFYEVILLLKSSEVVINWVTLSLGTKFDFQNKAGNRTTRKVTKSESKEVVRFKTE